ncbi:MAG TPA: RES family NAD+ phosphorylase [Thermoanaerobaculia bacterium]|nr:RES family NAD+ phosphorylase [Thermoanaerobaculia bacterium]
MPPIIWTRCAARAEIGRLEARPWRVVEAQHLVSTRKLVDSDAEQQLLEELIERAKPPLPPEPELQRLHYLLLTPFRYPPLRHGSRFGTRAERGIWYGAEELVTAFAEAAYYRLFFLEGSRAALEPVMGDVSAFRVRVLTERGVDLTREPFAAFAAEISSPVSYETSQQLGRDLRAAEVEAFRYRSARSLEGGANFGLFTARAFASRRPEPPGTWYCVATRGAVEFSRRDVFAHQAHRFPREQFEVGGVLPAPAA